jgi:hypothetical protein
MDINRRGGIRIVGAQEIEPFFLRPEYGLKGFTPTKRSRVDVDRDPDEIAALRSLPFATLAMTISGSCGGMLFTVREEFQALEPHDGKNAGPQADPYIRGSQEGELEEIPHERHVEREAQDDQGSPYYPP